MKIDLDKIIPLNQLYNDAESVINKVKNSKQLYLFEDNMPQFVLMTIDEFQNLHSKKPIRNKRHELTKSNIHELLNGIGKKVFVENYYDFKSGETPSINSTLGSTRSRTAKARRLFKTKNHIKALKIIINSDRLEDEIISKALEIYKNETDDVEIDKDFYTRKRKAKIGRYARNVVAKLLVNGNISQHEVDNFQSLEFSKQKLNLNFPLLKKIDKDISIKQQCKDKNGYNRYYRHPIKYKDEYYLICSQWIEEQHRDKLTQFEASYKEGYHCE